MLKARISILVDGGTGVCDDCRLGDEHGVDADAFVSARGPDDVSLEREPVDARGGAQQVDDPRRVVLPVIARVLR